MAHHLVDEMCGWQVRCCDPLLIRAIHEHCGDEYHTNIKHYNSAITQTYKSNKKLPFRGRLPLLVRRIQKNKTKIFHPSLYLLQQTGILTNRLACPCQRQLADLDYRKDTRVLLNGVTSAVSVSSVWLLKLWAKYILHIKWSYLVPSGQQFGIRVLEETSDVCAAECNTDKIEWQQHWKRCLQVRPITGVVTCPYCSYMPHVNK